MHADATAFGDMFSSGRISLAGRHVMFDASAVGSMRSELLDNLGWEATRGILERIGYRCGRRDAYELRTQHSWSSEDEWLRAGLTLQCLQGMGKARLDTFEVDKGKRKLNVSGEWLDSFEAEQHMQQYGTGSRSVCWMLEGYASGYASEFLDDNAVCLETYCRARGDTSCRFELRSLTDWGKQARPVQDMLTSARFSERFNRCLRTISEMTCELEQTSLDAIFTTDSRGFISSCSQGAGDLFGITPVEAMGRHAGSFYRGGSAEFESLLERLLEQRRVRNYLTEFVTGNGKRTPVSLSASAIRDSTGRLIGTIGVAHDLTEVRRLEDELAAKNRFMANILRDSADAIITMDPNDIVTSWNRGAERMFGYTAEEIVGKPIAILVPQELRDAHELESIALSFHAQGAITSHQTERITKDGRRIQIIFTRTAIRDDSGKIIGSSSVIKDVTSLRNLERQLADAEHLATLGELSAGLAHEIKNPLAGIKGAIDVIRDSLPADDMHREVLGDVLHQVDRIDKTVKDLLNYAKPKPPSHTTVNLSKLVNSMVTIARTGGPKRNAVSIEVRQLSEIPEFTGDESQLEQVILNLLLNAQNAMPGGGRVEVVIGYDSESAEISMEVSDNGPGIPEEIIKRIFHPFFTTRTDGSGLGLATCVKNVQYHGGSIDVRSEVGLGTTFTVTIPLHCRIR